MARLSQFHNWHDDASERQDGISDGNVDITTGARHGFRGASMATSPDMTGCDRRPMSDRGVSRRVWEATTTVLQGSTMVLKTRRFCFEDGDDWDSQSLAPSVVWPPFQNVITMFLQAVQKTEDFKCGHSLKSRHAQIKVAVQHFIVARTGGISVLSKRGQTTSPHKMVNRQ